MCINNKSIRNKSQFIFGCIPFLLLFCFHSSIVCIFHASNITYNTVDEDYTKTYHNADSRCFSFVVSFDVIAAVIVVFVAAAGGGGSVVAVRNLCVQK